jgi:hypothetical protein
MFFGAKCGKRSFYGSRSIFFFGQVAGSVGEPGSCGGCTHAPIGGWAN